MTSFRTWFGPSQNISIDFRDPIVGDDFLQEFNLSHHVRASSFDKQKSSILWSISTISNFILARFSNMFRYFSYLIKPHSTLNLQNITYYTTYLQNGSSCRSSLRRLPLQKVK